MSLLPLIISRKLVWERTDSLFLSAVGVCELALNTVKFNKIHGDAITQIFHFLERSSVKTLLSYQAVEICALKHTCTDAYCIFRSRNLIGFELYVL